MFDRFRAIPRKMVISARFLGPNKPMVVRWATEGVIAVNWGDKLNPYVAEHLSGRPVVHRADVYPVPRRPVHYWIGSHLGTATTDPNSVVWGAGFISADVPIERCAGEIHAVRGWLSHQRLKNAGIYAPAVVGDPALLLPRIYTPKRKLPRKALGVIPHCYEWDEPFFEETRRWSDTRVIDICGGIEEVVEQIVACDRIISSSLHGIICADSYGVPAIWLKASDKPLGDGFKFRDYFSSVGRPDKLPLDVDRETARRDVEAQFFDYAIDIDLEKLWQACPARIAAR